MKDLLDKIAFIIGNFLMIGFFGFGIYKLINIKNMVDGVVVGCIVLVCGILGGILFYLLYVRSWVDGFFDIIYSPKKQYKKLRPTLSLIIGNIRNEKYEIARSELEDICEEYPCFFEAVFMLFELYIDVFEEYSLAYNLAERYFSFKKREYHSRMLEFVFRYADLLKNCGYDSEGLEFLQREYMRSVYSPHEKKMLQLRINNF